MTVGLLHDPLVPLDLGGWFNRVFGVMARDWRRGATLAAIPAGVYVLGLVAMIAAMPTEAMAQQRIAAATQVAEDAGRPVDEWTVILPLFGLLVAVIVAFVVVLFLSVSLYLAGAFHFAIRAANGQPSTIARAVEFARPRILPLIGWYVLSNVIMIVTGGIAMLPGLLSGVGALTAIGVLLWLPVLFAVMVVFGAVLMGVVVMERGGPRRAVGLLKPRFWPTSGRLVIASLLYMAWGGLMNIALVPFTSSLETASVNFLVVLAAIVQGALLLPMLMFVAAVGLVTYAELRHREDRSINTGTLAAQLAH